MLHFGVGMLRVAAYSKRWFLTGQSMTRAGLALSWFVDGRHLRRDQPRGGSTLIHAGARLVCNQTKRRIVVGEFDEPNLYSGSRKADSSVSLTGYRRWSSSLRPYRKVVPINEALVENCDERLRRHLGNEGYSKFDDIEAGKSQRRSLRTHLRAARQKLQSLRHTPDMRQLSPLGGSTWVPKRQKKSRHRWQDLAPLLSEEGSKEPIHMVQLAITESSNEIIAIPALLDMMAIEGAVVTVDAMECQRSIAGKIIDKKANDVLALKRNQGILREDVGMFAAEQNAKGLADGDHGRIETRTYTAIHDVEWLRIRRGWPGLRRVVMVKRQRDIDGRITKVTRFYITSPALLANAVGPTIRDHWAMEN